MAELRGMEADRDRRAHGYPLDLAGRGVHAGRDVRGDDRRAASVHPLDRAAVHAEFFEKMIDQPVPGGQADRHRGSRAHEQNGAAFFNCIGQSLYGR